MVRLPFLLLFALSTWLMYRLAGRLYGPRAGLWAAVALNLSPVFGITTGSWVLPDGPLDAALLAAVLCLTHAVEGGRHARAWWLAAGAAAGAALFSKYLGVLTLLGAVLYLLSQPRHRAWLGRPDPWLAAVIAFLACVPIIGWNAAHGWASFAFQGGRAATGHFHPFAPFLVLGGEAVFVLPWIWLPMMVLLLGALRRGPANAPDWLLACLALPPILLFAVVSLWSPRILFHWAAPGYLMLFPLLGRQFAGWIGERRRFVRAGLLATAGLLLAAGIVLATDLIWPWLPGGVGTASLRQQAMSWRPLSAALDQRGLGGDILAAVRWHECGKLDYALGTDHSVLCLTPDAREFAFSTDLGAARGRDILIVAPRTSLSTVSADLGTRFASIEALPPIRLSPDGPVVPLYLGHDFRD